METKEKREAKFSSRGVAGKDRQREEKSCDKRKGRDVSMMNERKRNSPEEKTAAGEK